MAKYKHDKADRVFRTDRFVKKQQMSWSRRGAHLLLQVRTRVLNEELREKFDEWYPGFNAQSDGQARAS